MPYKSIEIADLLAAWSLLLGYENLEENRQQSAHNDVSAANDRQAAYLMQELSQKFDEQNVILKQILKVVEK